MRKIIATEKAPKAIGPYSQAVQAGELLFISGQIPLDPETSEIVGSNVSEQAEQVFRNIGAILKAVGLDYRDVVKTTVLLKSIQDFGPLNDVYARYFTGDYPARAAYEVGNLPKNALVEIEAVATLSRS